MRRTIIDILRKGNLELFHSSIISWLLDPNGEHNLGSGFLNSFADIVAERGCFELKSKLDQRLPESINTEATSYKSRYDILIHVDGERFVIENKTKSIGGWPQFHKYRDAKSTLIALGYTDISFSDEVKSNFPLITYKDILGILNSLSFDDTNDFTILIKHYRAFLNRELSVFDLIDRCYSKGDVALHSKINDFISSANSYNMNDRRFFNLYYLERFKNYLLSNSDFAGRQWGRSKDEISGVWIANYNSLPERYQFVGDFQNLCHRMSAHLWFHLELRDGVFANRLDDIAGVIQLRCESGQKNREFLQEFKSLHQIGSDEIFCSRVADKAKTFYLVSSGFRKRDLLLPTLLNVVQNFMSRFGNFQ